MNDNPMPGGTVVIAGWNAPTSNNSVLHHRLLERSNVTYGRIWFPNRCVLAAMSHENQGARL